MSLAVAVHGASKEKKNQNVALDLELKKEETSSIGHATAVRVQQHKWRQGTRSTKMRGEVAFSGKKPWKQKGTGRARCGTKASPLWRKGGVIFGPKPGLRALKVNNGVRARALADLFRQVVADERLCCLDFALPNGQIKATQAAKFLKASGLADQRLTLFLGSDDLKHNLVFRNFPLVDIVFFNQPNVVDLSVARTWAFLKDDKELFEGMVKQWI